MVKQYRTREGEATAVDTKTQLTTLGSESAPGPLLVPAGMTKLAGIIAVAVQNNGAATGYTAFCRVEGPGLPQGPEAIVLAAGGNAVATGGNLAATASYFPLNVPVTAANEVLLFGEMAGTDVGQVSFSVTCVFTP